MHLKRQASGLYVVSSGGPPQVPSTTCSIQLDTRIDRRLINLFQRLYRSIGQAQAGGFKIRMLPRRGLPMKFTFDPIEAWTMYFAVLIYGAAEAALILDLHNLGRETKLLERSIFEYLCVALYYSKHPREADDELLAEPIRELELLEALGYDRRRKRFKDVAALARQLRLKRPGQVRRLAKYKNLHRKIGVVKAGIRTLGGSIKSHYALHYRVPSQVVHGTVLGLREVVTNQGITFDSRQKNPNVVLWTISLYLIEFLRLQNRVFSLGFQASITQYEKDLTQLTQLV